MTISKLMAGTENISYQKKMAKAEQDFMRTSEQKVKNELPSKPLASTRQDTVAVSPVWKEIAQKIDVRSASPREIITLSRELYDAGAISYDDHLNLSFQPEVNLDSLGNSKPFSHEKKDYVALWQAKQESVIRQGGDRNQIEDTHRIQSILRFVGSLNKDNS